MADEISEISIGLLGYGTVGSGVGHILSTHADNIADKVGARLVIRKVLVRSPGKPRKYEFPEGAVLASHIDEILSDDSIDIVVEVMGGIDPAREWVTRALSAGKHVVTANKELMAAHGGELLDLSTDNKVDLFFEASVAGGIPVIHPLKESLAGNDISLVMGIVNGTTNYILSQMERGAEFGEALAQAQELGFAEADPSADIEGRDAASKVAILASIAFGSRVTPKDVYTEGISRITRADIKYAQELGWVIKLIALAKQEEGRIDVRVHPTLLPGNHPLASVKDVFNAIFLEGDSVGELMFFGQGAGSLPTASAIVGDLIDAARNSLSGASGSLGCTCLSEKPIKPIEEVETNYYIRMIVGDRPGVLGKIAQIFGDHNVSLAKVLQMQSLDRSAELVFVTHKSIEADIQKSLKIMNGIDEVIEVSSLIRSEIPEGV